MSLKGAFPGGSRVYLVGAGPGDPELLTIKAYRLLQQAHMVVYDRLVSGEVISLIPPGVSRIFVGKANGCHPVPQSEINGLLGRLVRHGRAVVRLKEGDPFVFGRGGEEAEYLARHRMPFEVVPGITAAVACTAYAGIPLTHRELATGVRLAAGHRRAGVPLAPDWQRLADPDTTLVIYMGLANAAAIARGLITAGLSPGTPAAAIERGTTPAQRRALSTLAALPARLAAEGFEAPTLMVVGRVVSLAESLEWFVPAAAAGAASEVPAHA